MDTIIRDNSLRSDISENEMHSLIEKNMVNLGLKLSEPIFNDSDFSLLEESIVSVASDISFEEGLPNRSILSHCSDTFSSLSNEKKKPASFSYKGSNKVGMTGRILIKPKTNQSTISVIERYGCILK